MKTKHVYIRELDNKAFGMDGRVIAESLKIRVPFNDGENRIVSFSDLKEIFKEQTGALYYKIVVDTIQRVWEFNYEDGSADYEDEYNRVTIDCTMTRKGKGIQYSIKLPDSKDAVVKCKPIAVFNMKPKKFQAWVIGVCDQYTNGLCVDLTY